MRRGAGDMWDVRLVVDPDRPTWLARVVLCPSHMTTLSNIVRRHHHSDRLDTLFIGVITFFAAALIQLAI